jgi:hypothetical protein
MVSCHCLPGSTVQEEGIKMVQFRWLLLIILVLGCPILGNGCAKAVRSPGPAAAAPPIKVIYPLGYVATSTRDLTSPPWVKEGV